MARRGTSSTHHQRPACSLISRYRPPVSCAPRRQPLSRKRFLKYLRASRYPRCARTDRHQNDGMVPAQFIVHASLKAHTFTPAHLYVWDNFICHILFRPRGRRISRRAGGIGASDRTCWLHPHDGAARYPPSTHPQRPSCGVISCFPPHKPVFLEGHF